MNVNARPEEMDLEILSYLILAVQCNQILLLRLSRSSNVDNVIFNHKCFTKVYCLDHCGCFERLCGRFC